MRPPPCCIRGPNPPLAVEMTRKHTTLYLGCVYGGLMRLYAWINTHAITQSTITHKHKLFKVPRVLIDGLFQNEQLKKILFLHPVRKHVAVRGKREVLRKRHLEFQEY